MSNPYDHCPDDTRCAGERHETGVHTIVQLAVENADRDGCDTYDEVHGTECHQCGQKFLVSDDVVAHHLNEDDATDHDADADHVPYKI